MVEINLSALQSEKEKKREWMKKRMHWAMLCIVMFVLGTGFGMCLLYRYMFYPQH